jgi:O-acetylhomoserine (thiol)-lyase
MDNLKVVYMETITNPTMRVAQMDRIVEIAHQVGAKVIVDNTFASPMYCRPLNFGADIVIHSSTKYIGGHGTSLGGVLTCSKELARIMSWEPTEKIWVVSLDLWTHGY